MALSEAEFEDLFVSAIGQGTLVASFKRVADRFGYDTHVQVREFIDAALAESEVVQAELVTRLQEDSL